MECPSDLKYTKEHEWVRVEGNTAVVGITEFAQSELGEVVFVELPKVGTACKPHGQLCVVESTKAASDVYSPITGTVKEVNTALSDTPSQINSDPYNTGWMVKLENINNAELDALMSAEDYKKFLG
jgi:glycine cleavage system H protein